MAFFQCNYRSEVLQMDVNVNVLVPQHLHKGEKVKTLYLLHGYSGNFTNWIRLTNIERYADAKRIAVIMPDVSNSYYTDMAAGYKYFTYLTEELPQMVNSTFPLSTDREDTYVAGLSMGGYGALKCALTYPERYCMASSLSGALDVDNLANRFQEERTAYFKGIFGDDPIKNTNNDLHHLIKEIIQEKRQMPEIFIGCGTEDFLYEDNQKFRTFLDQLNVSYTYKESKGEHNWEFWDAYIKYTLDWMFQ
ncbi:MAG: esterase family protein [Acholeplasmataceae bacterium]|nr:esterase family protein [Acholeplasmataceae bacterium]